jgi:hypothetical protein
MITPPGFEHRSPAERSQSAIPEVYRHILSYRMSYDSRR